MESTLELLLVVFIGGYRNDDFYRGVPKKAEA